jgi:hypothetical protein
VNCTRGLGDRLSALEKLLLDAKNKVSEQQDLAAAFLQNQVGFQQKLHARAIFD